MTSGLETEWDYSGRKGSDRQKKKIGKANERKGKVKGGKDEEVNGQGGRGVPWPLTGLGIYTCNLTDMHMIRDGNLLFPGPLYLHPPHQTQTLVHRIPHSRQAL